MILFIQFTSINSTWIGFGFAAIAVQFNLCKPTPALVSYCNCIMEDQQEYEVSRILDRRELGGRVEYLIEWEGYPGEDTWEPKHHLTGCTILLEQFELQRSTKRKECSDRQEQQDKVKRVKGEECDAREEEVEEVEEFSDGIASVQEEDKGRYLSLVDALVNGKENDAREVGEFLTQDDSVRDEN
jgi:hypothetical protein